MISDLQQLENLAPEVKAAVIKQLNLLMRQGSPVVRYTWRELKFIAEYLYTNKTELASNGSGYCDALLKPYNKFEYVHIFAIAKNLATGDDLAALRLRVRADNQRLRRIIRKLLIVPEPKPTLIKKIKNKIGVK